MTAMSNHLRTRIKICGLRTPQDVDACAQAGADAVGFVMYPPSPRAVNLDELAQLAPHVAAWQTPVALFVNPSPDEVHAVVRLMPQLVLQFHGDEDAGFCEQFRRPYLKALRIKPGMNILDMAAQHPSAQAFLMDSWSENYGGSGHTFDWSLLPSASELGQPLILSGGLHHDNVGQAVSAVRPFGVDVSSGVEASRGVKNSGLIFEFCRAVMQADAQLLSKRSTV